MKKNDKKSENSNTKTLDEILKKFENKKKIKK